MLVSAPLTSSQWARAILLFRSYTNLKLYFIFIIETRLETLDKHAFKVSKQVDRDKKCQLNN